MKRLVGVGSLVVSVLLVALVAAAIVPTPLRPIAGPPAAFVFGAAVLPERIDVCGRAYRRSAGPSIRTREEATRPAGEPIVVVDPWTSGCVAGACSRIAPITPCAYVVYVEVRPDAFASYELLGGG